MRKYSILICLMGFWLVGCTTIPLYPIVKEQVMVADFDSTWKAALVALEKEKLPIDSFDKEKGIIQTKELTLGGEEIKAISQGYLGIFKEPNEGKYSLKVSVRPKDPLRTSVRITAYIRANFPEQGWYVKSSSGVIEDRLFHKIMVKLNQYKLLHRWF